MGIGLIPVPLMDFAALSLLQLMLLKFDTGKAQEYYRQMFEEGKHMVKDMKGNKNL